MAPNNFRLNATTFYFTYPKCDTTKEDCLKKLIEELPIKWAIVCQEKHKDGSNHLHACGYFTKKVNITNASKLDSIVGKHGNYQSMKRKRECVRYVTKESNYVAHGITEDEIKELQMFKKSGKSKGKGDLVVEMLKMGESNNSILEAFPGYYLIHNRQIKELRAEMEHMNEKKPTSFDCPEADESALGWKHVEKWLFDNILKEREFKKQQLWLWGPPGSGKSSVLNQLRERLRVYEISPDNWNDEYDDNMFDLAVIDEYSGQKKVTWMNRFVEGSRMPLPRRGTGNYIKKKNLPVIVCSNLSITECYSKCRSVQIDALQCRFQEVYVETPGLTWSEIEEQEEELQTETEGDDCSTLELLTQEELDEDLEDQIVTNCKKRKRTASRPLKRVNAVQEENLLSDTLLTELFQNDQEYQEFYLNRILEN